MSVKCQPDILRKLLINNFILTFYQSKQFCDRWRTLLLISILAATNNVNISCDCFLGKVCVPSLISILIFYNDISIYSYNAITKLKFLTGIKWNIYYKIYFESHKRKDFNFFLSK